MFVVVHVNYLPVISDIDVTSFLPQEVGGARIVLWIVFILLFEHDIIIKVKSIFLFGLFSLTIKQYHKKEILFIFYSFL